MLLVWEPPMYGRSAAGVSWTMATHQPAGPNQRFTVAYSSATVATPSSACGTRMLHELSPNMRTDRPVTHSAAGVLSTVIELAASEEPKNHAFQLCEPAWAAAE